MGIEDTRDQLSLFSGLCLFFFCLKYTSLSAPSPLSGKSSPPKRVGAIPRGPSVLPTRRRLTKVRGSLRAPESPSLTEGPGSSSVRPRVLTIFTNFGVRPGPDPEGSGGPVGRPHPGARTPGRDPLHPDASGPLYKGEERSPFLSGRADGRRVNPIL